MKFIRPILVVSMILITFQQAQAQLSWDLGASTGSYNSKTYSEVNLGLNWFLQDYLVWRNAGFARFPQDEDSYTGLDTSLRLQHYAATDSGTFGIGFFGGPGYRISKAEASAAFVEAGVHFKLGGLSLGGGVKAFSYTNPGKDSLGRSLPREDTVFFLILSGGGAL